VVYATGKYSINIDDSICGCEDFNNTGISKLCTSTTKIAKTIIQELVLPEEIFFTEYRNVRSKRFSQRKLDLEIMLNAMFLASDFMVANGFQRLTVLELNFASQDGSSKRSKRALPPDVGVIAKTALQFDPKGRSLNIQKYESEFRSLTANGTRLPKGERLNASIIIKDPKACSEKLTSLVPDYLLTNSGLNGSDNLTMGKSVQLKCPQHLQLSKDDDGMDEFDNQYTVLCNSRMTLSRPSKNVSILLFSFGNG